MSATHGGKGSKQRPTKDQNKFDSNWDAIFGKKTVENKDETSEKAAKAEDKIPQSTIRPG